MGRELRFTRRRVRPAVAGPGERDGGTRRQPGQSSDFQVIENEVPPDKDEVLA